MDQFWLDFHWQIADIIKSNLNYFHCQIADIIKSIFGYFILTGSKGIIFTAGNTGVAASKIRLYYYSDTLITVCKVWWRLCLWKDLKNVSISFIKDYYLKKHYKKYNKLEIKKNKSPLLANISFKHVFWWHSYTFVTFL